MTIEEAMRKINDLAIEVKDINHSVASILSALSICIRFNCEDMLFASVYTFMQEEKKRTEESIKNMNRN